MMRQFVSKNVILYHPIPDNTGHIVRMILHKSLPLSSSTQNRSSFVIPFGLFFHAEQYPSTAKDGTGPNTSTLPIKLLIEFKRSINRTDAIHANDHAESYTADISRVLVRLGEQLSQKF